MVDLQRLKVIAHPHLLVWATGRHAGEDLKLGMSTSNG